MKLSIIYLILMWIWYFGTMIWVYAALTQDKPRYFWVAGMYALVMLMDGITALAYQAQGQ